MKKGMLRREFLGLGCGAGGYYLGSSAGTGILPSGQESVPLFPWKYRELNVRTVKPRAYQGYFNAGCMFGVFESVAGTVAESLGKPYMDFPHRAERLRGRRRGILGITLRDLQRCRHGNFALPSRRDAREVDPRGLLLVRKREAAGLCA